MGKSVVVIGLKTLFVVLGSLILATVIYTIFVDGLPFRKDLLTPWMAATLVDFYINVFALAAWVSYKEASWLRAIFWVVLLVCLGSIATSAYILLQLFNLSPQESSQDPMYHILLRRCDKDGAEQRRKHPSVVYARIIFGLLGCLMFGTLLYTLLTDGSPFRKELLNPWLTATLIDFYINVVALSVWVAYKETSWISALFWIILLIGFGSITTCVYIVQQLFQLTSQDPLDLVFINSPNRQASDGQEAAMKELFAEKTEYDLVARSSASLILISTQFSPQGAMALNITILVILMFSLREGCKRKALVGCRSTR